jgi:LmbE family N-acetylglucosaminyl deacetylase
MPAAYTHVYLSPHYDDASLSCGGAIYQQTQAGAPVLVITVCAAPPSPGEPLSAFAQSIHHNWGNPDDVVAVRQAEDHASMAVLGADYVRLNLNDCIYRGQPEQAEWYYNSGDQLFGQLHPDDLPLVERITTALEELAPTEPGTILYAPLGVGNHVDHQLVHRAARQLRQQGWRVAFYEDYPYVDPESRFASQRPEHFNLALVLAAHQALKLQPERTFLSAAALAAKIKSVEAYASQLAVLFGGEAVMAQRITQYAQAVGQGQPAERMWLAG